MAIENILDNQNYANKDFQSVYQELVDTVGKLNNKWLIDGEGNESDPGVIIIKLLAASVDKISYILDKYKQESYPDTVQLDRDARMLFSPVYNMRWYRSAHGSVVIVNEGEEAITIPARLMLSTTDKSIVYTIDASQESTITPGNSMAFNVIEGRLKTLTIDGEDCITINNLTDNKLYLDDYAVAQNGIWVEDYNTNYSAGISTSWIQSDNIYVENWSNLDSGDTTNNQGKYYQFCIDPITNKPYLLFVDDVASKIGDGIRVQYLISSGVAGNVSSGKITEVFASDSELTINSDSLRILNILPIANGKDPETVEEAKRNYFKDIDICNTLVTLRDYANAIYLDEDLVSNCFVCDQNNDIQYSYKIRTLGDEISMLESDVDPNADNNTDTSNDITVYSLKFYGMGYGNPSIDTGIDDSLSVQEKLDQYRSNYNSTFSMINPVNGGIPANITPEINSYIKEVKSINHDFVSIRNQYKPCAFINNYTLSINLLYRQNLSTEQQAEIKNRIYYALVNNLNARSIDFGERVTYEKVQDIIYSTDNRILGASISGLDDIDFDTYQVYWIPYFAVPYYTDGFLPAASNIYKDSYAVISVPGDNKTYQLWYCNGDNWTDMGTTITYSDIQNQFPVDTDTNFCGLKSKETAWVNDYVSGLDDGEPYYICLSTPSKVSDTFNDVPVVRVTVAQTTEEATTEIRWPSTPQQTTYSDGKFLFKYLNKYYEATPVVVTQTVDNEEQTHYLIWRQENPVQLFYRTSSTNILGSFYEEKISSEIIDEAFDDNCEMQDEDSLLGQMQTDIYAKSVLAGKTNLFSSESAYAPTIQDTEVQANQNIEFVEPSLELTLSSNYTLKDNEYIQVLNPEFTDITTYQFYVYMGYYSTSTATILTIGANSNYQLQPGEWIIFYYRSSDEDNFSYSVYGNGFVICPSKSIVLYNSDKLSAFQRSIVGSHSEQYYTASGELKDYLNNQVKAATTASASKERLTYLKAQDSCVVRRLNNGVLTQANGYQYVFKTNHYSNGLYSIEFNNNISSSTYSHFYVLEETESFQIYNAKNELITILGAGCMLYLDNGVASTSITSDGVTLQPVSININYMLCEIDSLTPGTVIKPVFGVTATYDGGTITVNQSATDYNGADQLYQIELFASDLSSEYSSSGNNTANIPDGTLTNDYTYYNQLLNTIQQSVNERNIITDEATVTFYIKFNNLSKSGATVSQTPHYFAITYDVDQQTTLELTSDFKPYSSLPIIRYKTPDDNAFTELIKNNITGFTQTIRAALVIDISDGSQEIITYEEIDSNIAKQSVYGYQSINESEPSLSVNAPADYSGDTKTSLLSTDASIYIIGGKQQLTSKITLYVASKQEDYSEDNVYQVNYRGGEHLNTVIIVQPGQTGIMHVPASVYGDGYIIFSQISSCASGSTISIYTDSQSTTLATNLYDENIENYAIANGDKLIIKVGDIDNLYIQYMTDSVTPLSVQFNDNIVPYAIKPEFYGGYRAALTNILNRIKELDTKSNYYIDVNATYPIDNPLSAASFLNSEHIDNKFTICRMENVNWR